MEKQAGDETATRPKSLVKSNAGSPEPDGADEKMLPKDKAAEAYANEKQNGDAKLDMVDVKAPYIGMAKEELMKYANDPFWVRLRWFLFITFWLLWGAMLVGAIMIIYAAPKCDPPPPKTWWEQGPLKQVQPDITPDQLKSLQTNQVQGIIVKWPEDTYQTFHDNHSFVNLLKKAKEYNLHTIVELEPGHSQRWFNDSVSKVPEFVDYYIWRPKNNTNATGHPVPPNNWLTIANTSSWVYSSQRDEFYYAPRGQPHLNFRHAPVVSHFTETVKRFLSLGANGITLRGASLLFADPLFTDEIPKPNNPGFIHDSYLFYRHTKTEDLEELGPLLQQWRKVVKNATDGQGVFMVADELQKVDAYRVNGSLVVDLPLQERVFSKEKVDVTEVVNAFRTVYKEQEIAWPLWKHNTSALPSDVLDVVTLLLPGTALVNGSVDPELLKLRDSPSVMRGILNYTTVANSTGFAFIRMTPGNPGILVIVNPTEERMKVPFVPEIPEISEEVTIQYLSKNYNETDHSLNMKKTKEITVSPKSAVVLSYVPKKKED